MPTQLLSRERASLLLAEGVFVKAPSDHEICPDLPAGTITDDTDQALLLADHLIDNLGEFDSDAFAASLLEWEALMRAKGSLDLLGPSTKAALELVAAEGSANVSLAGTTNGASMRIPAVGLINSVIPATEAQFLVDQVRAVNRISHNSWQANVAATFVAVVISSGLDGFDLDTAFNVGFIAAELQAELMGANFADSVFSRLRDVGFAEVSTVFATLGEHFGLEFLEGNFGTSLESEQSVVTAVALAALSPNDPYQAALWAAKLGGDSDTIAAISAAVVAACGGWSEQMDWASEFVIRTNKLELNDRAERLVAFRGRKHD
jgi:ADP-ribosylglycohydrolase